MSEVPLTRRKPIKTVEEIKSSPAFAALPSANQRDYVLLLAGGSTPLGAVQNAFHFKSSENARNFMYKLFKKTPMKNVLRELYGEGDKADFLRDIDRAYRNPKITMAQVRALLAYGIAKGFLPPGTTLLSDDHDWEDDKPLIWLGG